jgi:hypothetical protein
MQRPYLSQCFIFGTSSSMSLKFGIWGAHLQLLFFFVTGSTAPVGPGLFFQFHDHFTDGGTPWMSDQLVARPLPKHRTTQTQNKHSLYYISHNTTIF